MKWRTRKARAVLLAVSLAAGTLLSLDKIGVTPLVPGLDVGLTWQESSKPDRHEWTFSTDVGDVKCFLLLKFRLPVDAPYPWKASLRDGPPLRVEATPSVNDRWTLRISEPQVTASPPAKFQWPSGGTEASSRLQQSLESNTPRQR